MKVVILALAALRPRVVKLDTDFLVERGAEVTLVTRHQEPWDAEGIDQRVRVVPLREGEVRHPILRAERVLVFRIPKFGFRVLHGLTRPAGRVPPGRPLTRGVGFAERVYEKLARGFHRKLFLRLYRVVQPYVLWRVARRSVVRGVNWDEVDLLVVADAHAIPMGWHLARRHRNLTVTFSLDRAAVTGRSESVAEAAQT